MKPTDQPDTQPTPAATQPCTGPGARVEITSSGGVTRETWHSCPACHGSH